MAPALLAILIYTVIMKKKEKKAPIYARPAAYTAVSTTAPGRTKDGVIMTARAPLKPGRNDHLSITGRSI